MNIDNESSKSGVKSDDLNEIVEQIAILPRLRLRGLMALPAPAADFAAQRGAFAAVKNLWHQLNTRPDIELDTLSMGTSADFRAAISEQATIIRIGTALFGPRVE